MQSSPRVRRLAGWQHVLCRQHERRRRLLPGLKKNRISVCLVFTLVVTCCLFPCRATLEALWCASAMGPTTLWEWWAGETVVARSTSRASTPTWADLWTGSPVVWSHEDVLEGQQTCRLQIALLFLRRVSETHLSPSLKNHITSSAYATCMFSRGSSLFLPLHVFSTRSKTNQVGYKDFHFDFQIA